MRGLREIRRNGPSTEGGRSLGRPQPVRGREQAGQRPVVVLSHDVFNQRSGTVIAMAVTSQAQRAGFPLTLELPKNIGLPKQSWVKISQVRTPSLERLGKRIGRLPPEMLDVLVDGLNEIIAA